ncbi:hypothetical protein ACQ4LE_005059 [Meloidogyne hapla]
MTPSSSGQHLKRNGINTQPIKNPPDKIKNYKPPTRIKSKERQTAIQVDNGNLSRERHLGEKSRSKIIRIEMALLFYQFLHFFGLCCMSRLGSLFICKCSKANNRTSRCITKSSSASCLYWFISGFVSLFGMFGSLRDNVFLLKLFALCVFFGYLFLVVCTCLLFLLIHVKKEVRHVHRKQNVVMGNAI